MERKFNYYEILDLTPQCRMEDIERAYKIAKNTYGSQNSALYSLYDKSDNADIIRKIEEAYSVLSTPEKRKEYDRHKGFLPDVLSEPAKAIQDGKTDQVAREESKYHSTLSSSNVNVSRYTSIKRYDLDYTVDPHFEKEIESSEDFSGDFLKKIREYKNMDLKRLSDLTKVSISKLVHIEEENFSKLPARIYIRGYLFQYAKCLKLPIDKVIQSYLKNVPVDG